MPPGSEATRSERVAAAGALDRLSAQKDEVLHRVLSFLPSRQAVKTCLLARRWHHVWKSARGLRVNGADDYKYQSANHMNMFVNSLLLIRKPSPIDIADINSHKDDVSYVDEKSAEPYRHLELWIRYCLSWEARMLCVRNNPGGVDRWLLPRCLIISNHLMVLELVNVRLEVSCSCLDFSSCPLLENLSMKECDIDEAIRIMSPSVKRLSMKSCYFPYYTRTEISFPNLIIMELADSTGCTPLLHSMPLLVSAFVRVDCDVYDMEDSTCVILGGLSNSTHLELTSPQYESIFRKDLTWCPVFSKLKTLVLNEWCVTADLGALICFLQHCPILEKLSLQFREILEHLVEAGASYDMLKEPFALERLTVEVKCHDVDDERIQGILNLLQLCGVPSEKIKIQQPPKLNNSGDYDRDIWPSLSFSFEQEYSDDDEVTFKQGLVHAYQQL